MDYLSIYLHSFTNPSHNSYFYQFLDPIHELLEMIAFIMFGIILIKYPKDVFLPKLHMINAANILNVHQSSNPNRVKMYLYRHSVDYIEYLRTSKADNEF